VALCHSRVKGNPFPMPGTLLALLQFFFALTWVVYVIYLPALAEQAGLDRRYVPMILVMDQVIFIACDWAAGVYADRIGRVFGRIGGTMALATVASCAAFMAMPWVAPSLGAPAFLLLTVLWSITSSALRAPPFALVSRHTSASRQPWLASAYLLGLGLASAVAPFLGIELKRTDPRVPFAVASLGLALFAIALSSAERHWSGRPEHPPQPAPRAVSAGTMTLFVFAVLLFGVGFQVHFAINSGPSYLRFARLEDLPKLMPVFWIGFNLAILPATILPKRLGGSLVMAAAGAVGVVALIAAVRATSLEQLMIAQAIAGASWAIALMSAFTAALEVGKPGREGLLTGILFSTLAAAAAMRLGLILANVQASGTLGPHLANAPIVAWALAAFLVAIVAYRRARDAED
jgi:hypothetical protein